MVNETKSPGWDTGADEKAHAKFNGSKYSAQDCIEQFRKFARQKGFELPAEIIGNGERQYFGPKDACRYVLHLDGKPNGWVQDWRQGATRHSWKANGQKLNHEERERADAEIKAAKAKREADKADRHAKTSATAERLWNEATPGREDHPYLVRKRVKPHGLRELNDELLIPIRHDGKLAGLQFINADGSKRFLSGTIKHYYVIGEIEHADRVCIAEGFATAATIYEATGIPCAVAFDAGNLLPAAKALKSLLPGVKFTICADDDWRREGNPGLTKAREAAQAIGARLAVPDFQGCWRQDKHTDFNDLFAFEGGERVKKCIERAAYAKQTPGEGEGNAASEAKGDARAWRDPKPLPNGP